MDLACRSFRFVNLVAPHKATVHKNGVLVGAADERRDDMVSDLAFSRLWAEEHFVVMVELSFYCDFAIRELWQQLETWHKLSATASKSLKPDRVCALYMCRQTGGIAMQLFLQLLDHVDFPIETLDLPHTQSKRNDGHDTQHHKERAARA